MLYVGKKMLLTLNFFKLQSFQYRKVSNLAFTQIMLINKNISCVSFYKHNLKTVSFYNYP